MRKRWIRRFAAAGKPGIEEVSRKNSKVSQPNFKRGRAGTGAITAWVRQKWCVRAVLAGLLLSVPLSMLAVTLDELLNGEKLTPRRFAAYFKDFEYKFHTDIQSAEVFLQTQAGDCDDYATLADRVLRKHGYTTRLISVRMPGLVTHVVCYVVEEKLYLDFNNRVYLSRTERSDPDLRTIAQKVARSFEANWTSVSEFTYRDGIKEMVRTESKTDAYGGVEDDKKAGVPGKKKIIIDF